MKRFAGDNFEFDDNGRKFSRWVENTVGKGDLLVTSNFSFSKSVFKRLVLQTSKNQGLLERSSDLSNSGEFERQTASEIAF